MSSSLAERARPQHWSEVVGQDKAVQLLSSLPGGPCGRAIWITGKSGCGKTTLALILARSVADELCIVEVDGGELTAAGVRELEAGYRTRGFGRGGRVVLVNEAHGLRKDAVRALLVVLERIPQHVTWIFTTTLEGAETLFEDCIDGSPLLSRCLPVVLSSRGLAEAFAARAREVAAAEGLDGRPLADYVRLAKDCRNNLRLMLARIEAGWGRETGAAGAEAD